MDNLVDRLLNEQKDELIASSSERIAAAYKHGYTPANKTCHSWILAKGTTA